jgi:monofunctional biosynthetic peptidoglycan transglycosylase
MIARLFSFVLRLALFLALALLVLIGVYAWVPPVSTPMLWRWLTGERVVREWRDLEVISPHLIRAVVLAEDARFCSHAGVDWTELGEALDVAEELSDVRGASTIAMQTARNLFLWQGRHFVRKALEIPIAYYLHLMWPKRRIVEVYLNIAEWGPNGEFGAEAAARRAFRKGADLLSPDEAALLAASLPNPKRRDAARPGPGLRQLALRHRFAAETSGAAAIACLALGNATRTRWQDPPRSTISPPARPSYPVPER